MEDAALRAIHQVSSPLNTAFFSRANMDRLQTEMRETVRRNTGQVIGRQSDTELLTIMRYVYMDNANEDPRDVNAEMSRLNALVLAQAVPIVTTGVLQYVAYVKELNSPWEPPPRGVNASIKGMKTDQLFTGP